MSADLLCLGVLLLGFLALVVGVAVWAERDHREREEVRAKLHGGSHRTER